MAATMEYRVREDRTVPHLLPEAPEFARMPPVLATGYLVGLVEQACIKVVDPQLEHTERTVGVHVDLSHEAPSLPGAVVQFQAELIAVEGHQLTFAVHVVEDDGTVVCRGTHQRAVIDLARFERKARARRNPG
jgi:fluoroacetyl-CoA thioesterase